MSVAATTTAYDGVAYPSFVHFQTHPSRLAAQAALYGINPAPPNRCRVLELGCGDGTNLISMAFDLPESQFVGLDLAATAVARGQAYANSLGVPNVALQQADVAALPPAEVGTFDYVIAHGLYSWVPPHVRDASLALCGAVLAPHGVAFVSYNALPGGYVRRMVREMMRYHVARAAGAEPPQRVREARQFLSFLVEAQSGAASGDDYATALRRYGEHVRSKADQTLFHDELGEENAPFYLHEFAEQAGRHGLAVLCEAEYPDSHDHGLAPAARAGVHRWAGGDPVAVGQYADFVRGPTFHKTLLCRREANPARAADPSRLFDLYAASPAQVVWAGPGEVVRFRGTRPTAPPFVTEDLAAKAVMRALGESWPRPLHFGEVAAAVRGQWHDSEELTIARALLAACDQGAVDLFASRPAMTARPSERPAASLLARRQAEAGAELVTNLLGVPVALGAPATRGLLLLLDGSRDRAALVRDLVAFARGHGPPPAGWLEGQLADFARRALLTA